MTISFWSLVYFIEEIRVSFKTTYGIYSLIGFSLVISTISIRICVIGPHGSSKAHNLYPNDGNN